MKILYRLFICFIFFNNNALSISIGSLIDLKTIYLISKLFDLLSICTTNIQINNLSNNNNVDMREYYTLTRLIK